MLVVHMDSGLGNQMLDYAEYIAISECNTNEECILETFVYDLKKDDGMISQWNGYELDSVFGINAINIKDIVSEEKYSNAIKIVQESKFWLERWNYVPASLKALKSMGFVMNDYGKKAAVDYDNPHSYSSYLRFMLSHFFKTTIGYHIKRIIRLYFRNRIIAKYVNEKGPVFCKYPDNSYVGHSLNMKYVGFGLDRIEDKIRKIYSFPAFDETDELNNQMMNIITNCNSVAIHARRSDMLSLNGHCYKHGYFRRAVKYIKRCVENPVFIFFTDENSIGWCNENENIFAIDFDVDSVHFVTWNTGKNSYKDMQLMTKCKHNIFTESTFGFWGAFLNENPDKITCAPDVRIIATNYF